MDRYSEKFLTWSNFAFLIPLVLAIYFHVWLSTFVLIGVFSISFLYHRSEEKRFKHLDALLAWLLILSNVWICYLGKFTAPYFTIVVLLVVIALYLYFYEQKRNRILGHSFWHIFSSLITLFSILTFLQIK
jgi:hypothetical protein